jgi:hypothetical protein
VSHVPPRRPDAGVGAGPAGSDRPAHELPELGERVERWVDSGPCASYHPARESHYRLWPQIPSAAASRAPGRNPNPFGSTKRFGACLCWRARHALLTLPMTQENRDWATSYGTLTGSEPRKQRPDPYPVPLAGGRGPIGPRASVADETPPAVGRESGGASPPPSVFVYGSSRAVVNLTLFALAEDANPRFHWLDVRTDSDPTSQWDPVRMGWVVPPRLWSTDPRNPLVPDHPPENTAIFHLVRSDEPPMMLARLADFLRLPPKMQEILGEIPSEGGPNVLAVANADRMSGMLPPATLGPILDAFEWTGCSLFVGCTSTNPPPLDRFTHVVRIDGDSVHRWRAARVHFERVGATPVRPKPEGAPLTEIPFLERVFARAVP